MIRKKACQMLDSCPMLDFQLYSFLVVFFFSSIKNVKKKWGWESNMWNMKEHKRRQEKRKKKKETSNSNQIVLFTL